jgi:PAS domain S-box-containing protein
VRYRRKGGTVFDCQRILTTIKDETGKIIAYQGVNRDITARKQAEAALRESEERFRSLFMESPVSIIVHDKDTGEVVDANPQACAAHGFSTVEELQKGEFWFEPPYSFAEALAWVRRASVEGPQDFEWLNRKVTGELFWEQVRLNLMVMDGVQRVLATSLDITERKRAERLLQESEKRFRSLFQQSREAIAIIEPSGRILESNDAWLHLYGCTRNDLATIRMQDLYARPEERDDFLRRLAEQGFVQDEVRHRRKDGTLIDCQRSVAVTRNEEGEIIALQSLVLDITQQKRDREELETYRMDLQALAARLEEIREVERTGIARELHDQVGQALTALRMDLDAVRRALDRREEAPLARLNRMADLLDETVNDVRRISSELRPGILDDAGLAAAMEWQLDRLRERSTLHCSIEVQADDSVLTAPQTTALFRVFQELLTNVVRHATAESVSVSLSSDSNRFALTVADDGRGMTDEQANGADSLGLIGIRERLRPLGGEIRFSGAPGKGTNVCVTVPLR